MKVGLTLQKHKGINLHGIVSSRSIKRILLNKMIIELRREKMLLKMRFEMKEVYDSLGEEPKKPGSTRRSYFKQTGRSEKREKTVFY